MADGNVRGRHHSTLPFGGIVSLNVTKWRNKNEKETCNRIGNWVIFGSDNFEDGKYAYDCMLFDERILGDSDFAENVLKATEEKLEQKYDLKARGYNFDLTAQRVAKVMAMKIVQVTTFGKTPQTVKVRSLLCFWSYRKLGMATIEIGERLKSTT